MAGRDDRGEAEKGEKKLLIVAGETSGDQHGAHLLSALKERDPTVEVWSVGGEKLRRAGARQIVGIERLSVIGLLEVFKKAGVIVSAFRAVLRKVDEEKIRTAVLIDFPDFNLRLAKALKKRGVRVLYYISPQVWAWRKGRIHQIRRDVNHMFVIFPFEKEMYEEAGVPVSYIGHPLLDEPFPTESPEDLQRRFFPDFSQKEKRLLLFWGFCPEAASRKSRASILGCSRQWNVFDRIFRISASWFPRPRVSTTGYSSNMKQPMSGQRIMAIFKESGENSGKPSRPVTLWFWLRERPPLKPLFWVCQWSSFTS
ncbi:lipid A disaccharide synthase (LpxB) [Leptospirillum ferriphilum ML-04]|uniref:Lipid-A-disaccharide synthase n=1 Tax=Leptospirillum ferriphilum (strain ML-04) TaxID=1048260 RepID=J9ZAD1_LEPFM|nr:lipid A disaccharide synthase (LpxB) [Leptospirillum ferriphilum ML-04]